MAFGFCAAQPSVVSAPLRWDVSPTTADQICCNNHDFAEFFGYWTSTSFPLSEPDEPITFYDPTTSRPLFIAPVNRSWAEFIAESTAHGWPSFRDAEVVWENVRVVSGGETLSVDHVHLGHNIPDARGNRYCINLVCLASSCAAAKQAVDDSIASGRCDNPRGGWRLPESCTPACLALLTDWLCACAISTPSDWWTYVVGPCVTHSPDGRMNASFAATCPPPSSRAPPAVASSPPSQSPVPSRPLPAAPPLRASFVVAGGTAYAVLLLAVVGILSLAALVLVAARRVGVALFKKRAPLAKSDAAAAASPSVY